MSSRFHQQPAVGDPGRTTLRRSIAGSALGNAAEWYGYGVYSYLTAYMAANFFGNQGQAGTGRHAHPRDPGVVIPDQAAGRHRPGSAG